MVENKILSFLLDTLYQVVHESERKFEIQGQDGSPDRPGQFILGTRCLIAVGKQPKRPAERGDRKSAAVHDSGAASSVPGKSLPSRVEGKISRSCVGREQNERR